MFLRNLSYENGEIVPLKTASIERDPSEKKWRSEVFAADLIRREVKKRSELFVWRDDF